MSNEHVHPIFRAALAGVTPDTAREEGADALKARVTELEDQLAAAEERYAELQCESEAAVYAANYAAQQSEMHAAAAREEARRTEQRAADEAARARRRAAKEQEDREWRAMTGSKL